jgi:hypothetical protein
MPDESMVADRLAALHRFEPHIHSDTLGEFPTSLRNLPQNPVFAELGAGMDDAKRVYQDFSSPLAEAQ